MTAPRWIPPTKSVNISRPVLHAKADSRFPATKDLSHSSSVHPPAAAFEDTAGALPLAAQIARQCACLQGCAGPEVALEEGCKHFEKQRAAWQAGRYHHPTTDSSAARLPVRTGGAPLRATRDTRRAQLLPCQRLCVRVVTHAARSSSRASAVLVRRRRADMPSRPPAARLDELPAEVCAGELVQLTLSGAAGPTSRT